MLILQSYITNKALPTTKWVQIVDPKKFVIAALDADNKTFIVRVAIKKQEEMLMRSKMQAQIEAKA